MYSQLAEIILNNEKSDNRFELFCTAIFAKEEGVTFVPTSTSWDLGRDARSLSRSKGSHGNVICTTLNRDIEPKVDADLLRLTSRATPDRVIYCSSQRLSEHGIDEITKIVRRHVSNGSILIVGSGQLGALAEKHQTIFEKYYPAEIESIRTTILQPRDDRDGSTNGLRLALLTLGNDEGIALRDDISELSILELLSTGQQDSSELCVAFTEALGIPAQLPPTFLMPALQRLADKGQAQLVAGKWTLTEAGRAQHNELPVEAAKQLLEGRSAIREQLETLIGQALDSKQFSQIWAGLLDAISTAFHSSGLEVVLAMQQVLRGDGGETEADTSDLKQILLNGIWRSTTVISTADLRDKVNQGLLDILTERTGEGFEWLTRVAERFVVICSIGLEVSSSSAIKEVIASHRVILDSDIILDLLCDKEPEHKVSDDILRQWLKIGGKLLVAPIVLEEVAHHAWISDKDFKECQPLFSKLDRAEAKRYIKSAFVRTFFLRKIPVQHWATYIGQFRGNSSADYSKILRELRSKFPTLEMLPENYDEAFKAKVDSELAYLRDGDTSDPDHVEDVDYKSERDGRLLASIAFARTVQQKSGKEARLILLSSARRLRMVELKFKIEFGEERVVLSRKALAFLIAAIPDASLGADTLRRALFDFSAHAHLKQFERKALRLLRATDAYDLPWASRTLLQRNLADAITAEASKRGVHPRMIREEIKIGNQPDSSARVIIDSIVRTGLTSDEAKRLESSEKKIRDLEKTVADLESLNKTLAKRAPR